MISRRAFLAGSLGGLVGLLMGESNSEASLSSTPRRSMDSLWEEYTNYLRFYELGNKKREKSIGEKFRVGYEEWKTAIENPKSKEANDLRSKARLMSQFPLPTNCYLSGNELKEYGNFWRHFHIDVKKLKFDDRDPRVNDAILNYALPCIIEMQADIDRTYSPIEPGTDARRYFDYSNLSDPQKVLIFWHFKHEARYYTEGGKREPILSGEKDAK